ncbi:transcobalamin beta a [Hippocampus zosterae]|uniref:transcobalamin beta a n=1 Tax=Hippocampus zosterae TaxID=109293 RepID=UPI00223E1904|nr:transcobalamin beta a [Hippocampus zosterae]
MASTRTTLLFVVLLLFSIQGALTIRGQASVSIQLSVINDLSNMSPENYFTSVLKGGVLLGALRRIQQTQPGFEFTVAEDPNYGLFLESVNGVAGSEQDQTYWEILSENSEQYKRLNVGIGCYTPAENEHIVLRFATRAK